MGARIGLVLAVGSALVVDPVLRAIRSLRDLRRRAGAAGVALVVDARDLTRGISIRSAPTGEPLRTKVLGSLALTIVCIAVGAAIAHTG